MSSKAGKGRGYAGVAGGIPFYKTRTGKHSVHSVSIIAALALFMLDCTRQKRVTLSLKKYASCTEKVCYNRAL